MMDDNAGKPVILNRLKFFISRKSVFIKIVLSHIIIGSLLIALLSSLLYIKYSQSSIREIKDFSVNSLEQAVRSFDSLWNNAYLNMNREFKTNSTLIEAMDCTGFDPVMSGQVFRELNDIVVTNNIFDSIYVYNSKANMVFSSIGPVKDRDNFYDQGIIKVLQNSKPKVSEITDAAVLYRKMDYRNGSIKSTKNVFSVIFSDSNLNSAIVYNIDQSVFQNLIATKRNQSGRLMIISKEGTIISDSQSGDIFQNISDKGYIKKIMFSEKQTGYLVDYVKDQKSLITYNRWNKWNNLGWIIININDYDKLLANVKQLQRTVLLITFAFILFSILIAALSVKNIYSPIKRILGKFRSKIVYTDFEKLNEYAYLENVFDSLIHDNDSLKAFKNTSKIAVKKDLMLKILNGELLETRDEIITVLHELNGRINGNEFLVIVIKLDNIKKLLSENDTEDIALLRFSICNISEELFGEKYDVEAVDTGDDNITLIISFEKRDALTMENIKYTIVNIQKACNQYLNISFSAGIGCVENSLKKIYYSYENALDAANHRFFVGPGAVIDYWEMIKSRKDKYDYPFDIEKDIMDGIKAADENKVKLSLDSFINTIEKFSYDESRLAINQLVVLTLRNVKILLGAEDAKKYGKNTNYKDISNILDNLDYIDEITDWLMNFYKNTINSIKKRKENKYEDIVTKVQKYVDINYMDSNISVEAISGMVDLSPNYLRTLFKESTGKSLSAYINDVRFKKIMQLLIETDEPASKLAETVGFQGGGYFYTAFKRTVGMSPDEYRRMNKDDR